MIKCEICEHECKNYYSLRAHLWKNHNIKSKEYYDKYLKKENEGECKTCDKYTTYLGLRLGYQEYCSTKCASNNEEYIKNKEQSNMDKYGVKNVFQVKEVIDKLTKTKSEKYENGYCSEFRNQFSYMTTELEKEEYYNKFRKIMEDLGRWTKKEDLDDYLVYRYMVTNETRKYLPELFGSWDGLDYYTGEKLLTSIKYNNKAMYKSVDHKISIAYGFRNNIDYKEIGNINNLCVCSRHINSMKHDKNETEFKEYLKEKNYNPIRSFENV